MTSYHRRPLWRFSLFQVPLISFILCLVMALLFWLLGLGRPQVSVAIGLDLSGSTGYGNPTVLIPPGSVIEKEQQAIESYVKLNSSDVLKKPNELYVFGFGKNVEALTPSFMSNASKIEKALDDALNDPSLPAKIDPSQNDVDLAIKKGIDELSGVRDRCREFILVTDGQVEISPQSVQDAIASKIKINAVVIGEEAIPLRTAAFATGGVYFGSTTNLDLIFTEEFFENFNSNLRWILFWLAMAWISFMWLLTLPLDRWVLQKFYPFNLSGRIAMGNGLFWTVSTLSLLWKLVGIPFINQCG